MERSSFGEAGSQAAQTLAGDASLEAASRAIGATSTVGASRMENERSVTDIEPVTQSLAPREAALPPISLPVTVPALSVSFVKIT